MLESRCQWQMYCLLSDQLFHLETYLMLHLISQNPKSPIVLLYPLVPEVKFYFIQICPLYHKPVPYFQASLSHDLLTLNTAGVLRLKKVSLKSVTSSLCSRRCQSDNVRSSITSQKSLQGTTSSQWPREVTLREVKERMAQWPGNKGVTRLPCHCLKR